MNYILYGSATSPFVRRIRLLMGDLNYELREINPYDEKGLEELNRLNPLNQIPVLVDGDQIVWDSRQIFNHLNAIHKFQEMNLEKENLLTVIDGLMNAGITLMQLKRSGLASDSDFMLNVRTKARVESSLDYLKLFLKSEQSLKWNFHVMSLIAFLDWAIFRDIIKIDDYTEYKTFLMAHRNNHLVGLTKIPNT